MYKSLPLILATVILASCSGDETAPPPQAPQDPATPPVDLTGTPAAGTPAAGAPATDPALAPITSREVVTTGAPIAAPGAQFTLPESWIPETPSSSMRLAQARIPGDAGEGQLTVFYFGAGGGGGVESNLQRWVGQVEIDPDSQASRDSFSFGDFRATWVDVEGTIKPSTMGTGPTTPQTGSRLLAAVVEGPQGPWFFKATGPTETLAAQREAFLAMLRSAVPHG
ncbi:MAG: hypothetical protein GY719_20200 [bacterium]|nr:hypothetical protein [bacterium]